MHDAMWAMIGGVAVAVLGALVAAKLARVDRLWGSSGSGGGARRQKQTFASDDQMQQIQAVLRQAALAREAGRGAWQSLNERISTPMLREGLTLLADGADEHSLRTQMTRWYATQTAREERFRAAARWASVLAPVLGYGLIGVAAILSVRQLQVALAAQQAGSKVSVADLMARGGEGASGVMALMIIVIAAPLMNAMSRRLSRRGGQSAAPLHEREALSTATIEGLAAIAAGRTGSEAVSAFDQACAAAGLGDNDEPEASETAANPDVLGRDASTARPMRAA